MVAPAALPDRAPLVRRAQLLESLGIVLTSLEALVGIVVGWRAGSVALVGFGGDSLIEVLSAAALLWRLHHDADPRRRDHAERRALRAVGFCFLLLAAYVTADSLRSLLQHDTPEGTSFGIALAVASLVTMPLLARAKRRVAHALNSAALRADAKQAEFCTWFAAFVLAGLVLNAALGWWWADPAAALVMVPFIVKEGIDALRGHACACH